MLPVPQPLYNGSNYGLEGIGYDISADAGIYKLAYYTASSAQPVSLSSTYQNETYHMDFNGPAVKCGMANYSVVYNCTASYSNPESGGSGDINQFLSWVAGEEPNTDFLGYYPTFDQQSTDAARIFIMSNTGSWNNTLFANDSYGGQKYQKVNVTECLLYNATYSVDFSFQYPGQTRNISISNWLNPVAPPDPEYEPPDAAVLAAVISYSAMMSEFGKLLVGYSIASHYKINIPYLTSWQIINIDWTRAEAVQAGLEQLFQNFTLSLLSDAGLVKNSTQAELVPVAVTSWPITYSYETFELLIAYGLSFICALICSTVGVHAFLVNSASYQNLFSTFFRATSDPELRALVDASDSGADPLPSDLAKAEIMMCVEEERNE